LRAWSRLMRCMSRFLDAKSGVCYGTESPRGGPEGIGRQPAGSEVMSIARAPTTKSVAEPARLGEVSILMDRFQTVVPPEAGSLDGFRRWATRPDFPPGVRVLYDQGAICLDMSNEELQTHNKVKVEVSRVLSNLVHESDQGEFYGDGVLVTNPAAEVSNNPDAVFLAWETLDAGRVRLIPRQGEPGQFIEIEGTPDWVLEVVSLSSVQKDTQQLRQAYHRAGISEYWLVDARGEQIAFQILYHRKGRYAPAPVKDGWQGSKVFGRSFRLERVQGRRGLWRYTLHVRED
jgi:Uma2 family endonuclease